MNEDLLHTIWKFKLTKKTDYIGSKGEIIKVVSIGEHNSNSGPDFFNSKIEIDGILLAGNVEIHIKTSDWLKHNHQINKAYDNLILHVVYEHDTELEQNNLHNVPVLILKDVIAPSILDKYKQLETSKSKIACGKSISKVDSFILNSWLDRLLIARLEDKTDYINTLFEFTKNNLEETLYILLFRNFGFKINDEAFELLAKSLPYNVNKKYADNITQLEALLFGTAGMLNELFTDKYPKQLQNEFEFLKHKHSIVPIKNEMWKFSKTRPVNFPTIRISQMANLLSKQQSLFHFIENKPSIEAIRAYFDIETHEYFKTHFQFDSVSASSTKKLGETAINTIIINTIVPFLFFVSQLNSNQELQEYALNLLSEISAEQNSKIKLFQLLGINPKNAFETQALIKLYNSFCSKKACLHCAIGKDLLKNAK